MKNRLQERAKERFNEKLSAIVEKFYQAYVEKFMDPNVSDVELTEFALHLNNRWKVYCRIHKLNAQGYGVVTEFINRHNQLYADQKAGLLPEPEKMVESGEQKL